MGQEATRGEVTGRLAVSPPTMAWCPGPWEDPRLSREARLGTCGQYQALAASVLKKRGRNGEEQERSIDQRARIETSKFYVSEVDDMCL
jgi:hypothetical protein